MGFKDLVARLDDALREHDKGKSLKRKELKRLQQELEKKTGKIPRSAQVRLFGGNPRSDRSSSASGRGPTRKTTRPH